MQIPFSCNICYSTPIDIITVIEIALREKQPKKKPECAKL